MPHWMKGYTNGSHGLEVFLKPFVPQGEFDMHTDIKTKKKKSKREKREKKGHIHLMFQLMEGYTNGSHGLEVFPKSVVHQGESDIAAIDFKSAIDVHSFECPHRSEILVLSEPHFCYSYHIIMSDMCRQPNVLCFNDLTKVYVC